MASYLTVIEPHNYGDNRVVYTIAGHTFDAPQLLIQKRKEPTATSNVASDTLMVVFGDEDSAGDPLPTKIVFEATVRRSIEGSSTRRDAALADFRDFVASDEFTNMVTAQANLG